MKPNYRAERAQLIADMAVAADRLDEAWRAGVVGDSIGRRGREKVLAWRQRLIDGRIRRPRALSLRQWCVNIDYAWNLIERDEPPSP